MPPPVRKLSLEDNSILQTCGGVGAFRKSDRVEQLKRDINYHGTRANLRELGAAGAADLQEYGYMLVELPKWLSKLLGPSAVDSYITDAGGHRSLTALSRPEPLDNSYAFSEAAAGLAACSRLVATALLGHRQREILAPGTTELLQPVDSAYEHASAAYINLYEQQQEKPQKHQDSGDAATSAYSPHADGGLLTLVVCPVRDRGLVVLRPGGGEEHVPLEPGVAAVLPGLTLGQDPYSCNVPTFAVPYKPAVHWVDRSAVTARDRASVTFHLRPHPDAVLLSSSGSTSTQTARAFLERFYGSTDRINAAATAPHPPTASPPSRTVPPATASGAADAAATAEGGGKSVVITTFMGTNYICRPIRPALATASGAAGAAATAEGGGTSVVITTPMGTTYNCRPLHPWETLKMDREAIPEDESGLFFRGAKLVDERALASYNISDQTRRALLLVLKLQRERVEGEETE